MCVCLCIYAVNLLIGNHVIIEPMPEVEVEGEIPCAACGPFALCSRMEDDREICSCPVGYIGNPYTECRPECTIDSDCTLNLACINQRCIDPCPGICGINAECYVLSHQPDCSCPPGYTGDPYSRCFPHSRKSPCSFKDSLLLCTLQT